MTPSEIRKETPQELYDEIYFQGVYDDGGFTPDAIKALGELRDRALHLAVIEASNDDLEGVLCDFEWKQNPEEMISDADAEMECIGPHIKSPALEAAAKWGYEYGFEDCREQVWKLMEKIEQLFKSRNHRISNLELQISDLNKQLREAQSELSALKAEEYNRQINGDKQCK